MLSAQNGNFPTPQDQLPSPSGKSWRNLRPVFHPPVEVFNPDMANYISRHLLSSHLCAKKNLQPFSRLKNRLTSIAYCKYQIEKCKMNFFPLKFALSLCNFHFADERHNR